MAKITGRESDQFNLRFPDGMRDRLKEEAAKNGRSLNAEIIQRLTASLELDDYVPKVNVQTDQTSFKEVLQRLENLNTAVKRLSVMLPKEDG